MTDIDPIEQLQQEHRVIQQVIDGLAVLIEKLEAAKPVAPEVLADISEFLQRFAGDCHHGKEEIYLFRILEKNGVPKDGCPISALVHEHHKGRALLATLKLASKEYAQSPAVGRTALAQSLHSLTELYTAHIWKEEYLLFPMADKLLTSIDRQNLSGQFAQHSGDIGIDVHHAFEELARRILQLSSVCAPASLAPTG